MRRLIAGFVLSSFVGFAGGVEAQEANDEPKPPIRIFVTTSEAWAGSGEGGGSNDQTVEIQRNLQERCGGFRVTQRSKRAHFVVTLDRNEGNKLWGFASKDNKIALFDGWGDLLFSNSTRNLGNAVQDVCDAITREVAFGAELITVGEADAQSED